MFLILAAGAQAAHAASIQEFPLPSSWNDFRVPNAVVPCPADGPCNITSGPDGALWFTMNCQSCQGAPAIGRITTAGVATGISPQLESFYCLQGGSSCSPTGQTVSPPATTDITTGPDGNLWFTDGGAVDEMSTGGTGSRWFIGANCPAPGGQPGGTGQWDGDPAGIARGAGVLWFADRSHVAGNGSCPFESNAPGFAGSITPSGTWTETQGGGAHPLWITAGPSNDAYFTEDDLYGQGLPIMLGHLTSGGAINEIALPAGAQLEGVTLGPDNNIWFTDRGNSAIGEYFTSGKAAGTVKEYPLNLGFNAAPGMITSGPDGRLYFTEQNAGAIGAISPSSDAITQYSSPSLAEVWGITVGPDKNIWFTDPGNNAIGRLTLSGHTLTVRAVDQNGTPVPGVSMSAVGPEDVTGQTDANGQVSWQVPDGDYTIASDPASATLPTGGCDSTSGASCHINLDRDRTVQFTPNQVTIAFDPQGTTSTGTQVVNATITDQDANGNPVVGQTIQIEPPVTYGNPTMICDSSNRLVYPSVLADGFPLGSHFTRQTDQAGQIHLTIFVGAMPGDWLLQAGQPDLPRLVWGTKVLGIGPAGGGGTLPFDLPAVLLSQGDETLAAGGEASLLKWLGTIKSDGALGGIGFMPIHARDATIAHKLHDGVVLFPENQGVEERLFDYLDGKSSDAPGDNQAQVIDIDNLHNWQFGQLVGQRKGHTVQNRLQSLTSWENGELVNFGESAVGGDRRIAIPGRGRPLAGFAHPPGGPEDLLYERGPYPVFGGDPALQATFNKCIGYTFGTTITAHSPIRVLVTAGHRQAGISAKGKPVDTLPGTIVRYRGKHVTSITAPAGSYSVRITGTGRGKATLVVVAQARGGGTATQVFSFRVRPGERGSVAVRRGRSSMRFGGRVIRPAGGVHLRVRGAPRTLPHGRRATLALTIRDQFGNPAAGAKLSLSGVRGVTGITGIADGRGRLSVSIDPQSAGRLRLSLSGPGYLPTALTVRVT